MFLPRPGRQMSMAAQVLIILFMILHRISHLAEMLNSIMAHRDGWVHSVHNRVSVHFRCLGTLGLRIETNPRDESHVLVLVSALEATTSGVSNASWSAKLTVLVNISSAIGILDEALDIVRYRHIIWNVRGKVTLYVRNFIWISSY